jgi:hypothetical protein
MEAAMTQARYAQEQLMELDEARYSQKTDAIDRRVNAVYFYGTGQPRCVAARLAGICPNTLRKFAAAYASGGLSAVAADARQGPSSTLDPHVETITYAVCLNTFTKARGSAATWETARRHGTGKVVPLPSSSSIGSELRRSPVIGPSSYNVRRAAR